VRGNHPPTVHIQELKARTVKVGQAFTVVSEVKDDGIPKRRTPSLATLAAAQQRLASDPALAAQLKNPSMSPPARITVGKNLGLHVSWFVYRGPIGGRATFGPPQVKPWEDTRAVRPVDALAEPPAQTRRGRRSGRRRRFPTMGCSRCK
jgi:hypothetical protein